MKLRNKRTGEIVVFGEGVVDLTQIGCKNVAEMIARGWEDYEEPKKYHYFIDATGRVIELVFGHNVDEVKEELSKIGNYFETRKDAEKAVEKLKAWKRLKDKGFKFNGVTPMEYFIRFTYDKPRQILDNQQHPEIAQQFNKDLDLLFGGEE